MPLIPDYVQYNPLVRFHQFGSVVLDLINILNLGKFNLRTLGSWIPLEFIFTVATFCA